MMAQWLLEQGLSTGEGNEFFFPDRFEAKQALRTAVKEPGTVGLPCRTGVLGT